MSLAPAPNTHPPSSPRQPGKVLWRTGYVVALLAGSPGLALGGLYGLLGILFGLLSVMSAVSALFTWELSGALLTSAFYVVMALLGLTAIGLLAVTSISYLDSGPAALSENPRTLLLTNLFGIAALSVFVLPLLISRYHYPPGSGYTAALFATSMIPVLYLDIHFWLFRRKSSPGS